MRKLFILFFSCMLSTYAYATTTVYYQYGVTGAKGFSDPVAACKQIVPSGITYSSMTGNGTSQQYACRGKNGSGTESVYVYLSTYTAADCPAGQSYANNVCTATGPDCSSTLPIVRRYNYGKGVANVAPKSYGGCAVNADELLTCRATSTGSYCMWQVTRTGSAATDTSAPAGSGSAGTDEAENTADKSTTSPPLPANASGNCPAGSVQAGYDSSGITICVGTGTSPGGDGTSSSKDARPSTTTTSKSTDAAGNVTETTTTTTKNSDGSTTTTTTAATTGADGSKSVTGSSSTGKAADGNQGVPDPDPSDFCTQHPDLSVCKNSSVTGTCGAIACTGDAIQCATLQQAAAMRCAKDDDDKALKATAAYTLGQNVLNGADPLSSTLPTRANATAVSVPAMDSSGWLGGGSCFPDKTFSVQGRSFTISFSQACNVLVALRYALMVAASLVAFKIVRGAFLSE